MYFFSFLNLKLLPAQLFCLQCYLNMDHSIHFIYKSSPSSDNYIDVVSTCRNLPRWLDLASCINLSFHSSPSTSPQGSRRENKRQIVRSLQITAGHSNSVQPSLKHHPLTLQGKHSTPCTVYRVPCTVYRVPCTVYGTTCMQ